MAMGRIKTQKYNGHYSEVLNNTVHMENFAPSFFTSFVNSVRPLATEPVRQSTWAGPGFGYEAWRSGTIAVFRQRSGVSRLNSGLKR